MGSGTSDSNVLKQTLNTTLDVATLGSSYYARKGARQQEKALNDAEEAQRAEMARLEQIGPAPTIEQGSEAERERTRRNRLKELRKGIATTVNALPNAVAQDNTQRTNTKNTLGA